MRLILLVSGKLGSIACKEIPYSIEYIFTDKQSTEIVEFASKRKIPVHIGNPRKIEEFSFLDRLSDCWILSINYLFIIPQKMIEKVNGNALNVHGSLLPQYRGRTPHVWAIINGESFTGITIHRLVEAVDSGDILLQKKIGIAPDDTGGTVLAKYEKLYPEIVKEALSSIVTNTAVFIGQNNSKATYFPKRSPSDGRVCWDWQDQRIINWVRAQTAPYPGAFSISGRDGGKVLLWECQKDDWGFSSETPNGTIVKKTENELFVKCPNRIIKIAKYEGDVSKGDTLL